MQVQKRAYLDLSVMDELRSLLLTAAPVVMFSDDLDQIYWANAAGAEFFGGGDIAALLDTSPSHTHPFMRQLKDVTGQLKDDETLYRGFRVTMNGRSILLQCEIERIHLGDGTQAIIMGVHLPRGQKVKSRLEVAEDTVAALDEFASAVALVDDEGKIIAASANFAKTRLSKKLIRKLSRAVSEADNRLVKRSVENKDGRRVAAGLAHVEDNCNLVVLVELESHEEQAPRRDKAERAKEDGTVKPKEGKPKEGKREDSQPSEAVVETKSGLKPEQERVEPLPIPPLDPISARDTVPALDVSKDQIEALADESEVLDQQEEVHFAKPAPLNEYDGNGDDRGEDYGEADHPNGADDTADDTNRESGFDLGAGRFSSDLISRIQPQPNKVEEEIFEDEKREEEKRRSGEVLSEVFDDEDEAPEIPEFTSDNRRETSFEIGDHDNDAESGFTSPLEHRVEEVIAEEPIPEEPETLLQDEADDLVDDEGASDPVEARLDTPKSPDAAQETADTNQPDAEKTPGTVRFGFFIDQNQVVRSLSADLAAAVGPDAADIVDRNWSDISNRLGIDDYGSIASLLERNDTWSGKTVLWPIEGTDMCIPIDLAALPVFDSNREFEGFRGFGVIRSEDIMLDPGARGMNLAGWSNQALVDETHDEILEGANNGIDDEAFGENDFNAVGHNKLTDTPLRDNVVPLAREEVAHTAFERLPSLDDEQDHVEGDNQDTSTGDDADTLPDESLEQEGDHQDSQLSQEATLNERESEAFKEIGKQLSSGKLPQSDLFGSPRWPGVSAHMDNGFHAAANQANDDEAADASDYGPLVEREHEWRQELFGADASLSKEVSSSLEADEQEETELPPETALETLHHDEALPAVGDITNDFGGKKEEPAENSSKFTIVNTEILSNLPTPVIIYNGEQVLFANPELLDRSGYGSVEDLQEAGGVDAILDADEGGNGGGMIFIASGGRRLVVSPVLQTVPWGDEKALLLSFNSANNMLPVDEKLALDMARVSDLQGMLETATDGILVLDSDSNILSCNDSAQALFGYKDEEVLDLPVQTLFATESHEALAEYIERIKGLIADDLPHGGCELIGQDKDSNFIPIFATIGKIGGAGKLCAVLRDLTQWKKTEEALVSAKRAAETASEHKSEFLARVSHEIRSPLNSIIGFSDVMIDEKFGPIANERYKEYLHDINRSGEHVLDLINDLLDLSKIEAGKMEMNFEAVNLNQIVAETVALLQPQANNHRIIIRTSLSRAVPKVVADARSIRQIVLNLVSNAIRFTSPNGQVIVSSVYEANGEVALRIRDTGEGMSRDEIEAAMQPFRQIHAISENRGEGTGLGLPLTRALVEANRAHFDIESEKGEGTIVHVQFPAQRVLAD